jgi:uncharacterized protein
MVSKRLKRRAAVPYRRPIYETIAARAHEDRRFLQVLAGPRQVGKTTLARQVMDEVGLPAHFASADDPALRDRGWLETQWQVGRARARDGGRAGGLLVMDEIQKIPDWSELVKRLWDEDTASGVPLRVMLLGSAPLLVQRGLTESLAGRFELVRVSHWSFGEMRDAFGFDLDRYLFFGGYPGAAALTGDEDRWRSYVLDSLVETSLARDVLLMARVDKPALLRQLFRLGCERSGEVLPYHQMLGRLHDAGNTVTLSHYLELLAGAGLLRGLPKHAPGRMRRRASSPKLLAMNTALISAMTGRTLSDIRRDATLWARLVDAAIGARLGSIRGSELGYWRRGAASVDFVAQTRDGPPLMVQAAEGRGGMAAFRRAFPQARSLIVGPDGVELGEFLERDPADWLR